MRQHFLACLFLNLLFLHVLQRPTALAKILGVFRIGYKNSQNNTEKKLDLLVMENLFYGRKMAQVHLFKPLNLLLIITDLTLVFQKNCDRQFGSFYAHILLYGLCRCLT